MGGTSSAAIDAEVLSFMAPELFWNFVVFAIVAAVTPGPNNIMLMASGVNFGTRASMPHYFGICFGAPVMFFATGLGLGSLIAAQPWIYFTIKVAGLSYLTYLAYLIAKTSSLDKSESTDQPLSFTQAMLFQLVNPKVWLMGSGAVAAFTTAEIAILPQVLTIAAVFFVIGFPTAAIWLLFGSSLRSLLERPAILRGFNILMAILLLASMYDSFIEIGQYVYSRLS